MSQSKLAAVPGDGLPQRGLPIGDMRGFGRVRDDAALDLLALDRSAGALRASHAERALLGLHMDGDVRWVSAYVPGTNVLETVGHAEGAELRVADFLAVAEGRPGQAEAVAAGRFVRIVSCTEGEVSFRLVCAAALEGESKTDGRTSDGWYVACSRPLGRGAEVAGAHVRLVAGESVAFVIADHAVEGGPGLAASALHALGETIHFWTWWSDRCRYKGDDFDIRLREALELKLGCDADGMTAEAPGHSFTRAPLGDLTRAAATFLDLGYRQESAALLARVFEHGLAAQHESWSSDACFADTLDRYVSRYGVLGLSEGVQRGLEHRAQGALLQKTC